jgi:hypothetical protein
MERRQCNGKEGLNVFGQYYYTELQNDYKIHLHAAVIRIQNDYIKCSTVSKCTGNIMRVPFMLHQTTPKF